MSDSYNYDDHSCLDKLIHGESATVPLLFAEYQRIKFHFDALDVSFYVLIESVIKST